MDGGQLEGFFNFIELNEVGIMDLELLVEAEARGLLDTSTRNVWESA